MLSNEPLAELTPQESSLSMIERKIHRSIGLLKDQFCPKGIVLLLPSKVSLLNEEDIHVWIQRSFGKQASITDLDYADAGADILDDSFSVIKSSDIIAKLEPFTSKEAHSIKENQIIVSSIDINNLSVDYFNLIREKRITAFGLDFIQDIHGNDILSDIFYRENSHTEISTSLSNFIFPILLTLALNGQIKNCIQTTPSLFQSLYCYNGEITRKEIADKMNLPWRDIFSIYWN